MAPSLVQFDLAAGEGESIFGDVAGGEAFGEGEVAVVEVVHAANDFEEGGCIGMAVWRAFFGQLRCPARLICGWRKLAARFVG